MLGLNNVTSLGDITRGQARVRLDKMAFHFEGRETSYGAFDDDNNRVANGLIAIGLQPGARVSYIGKNSDLYFEAVFGAAKAGIVMTPVNWRLAGPEMVYILNDARAEVLFVGGENIYPAKVENAIFGHPSIADVAVIGIPDDRWGEAVKACVVLKAGATASRAELIA